MILLDYDDFLCHIPFSTLMDFVEGLWDIKPWTKT